MELSREVPSSAADHGLNTEVRQRREGDGSLGWPGQFMGGERMVAARCPYHRMHPGLANLCLRWAGAMAGLL